jgi:biopolymer transport protein ExbB
MGSVSSAMATLTSPFSGEFWTMLKSGGFTMVPLLVASLVTWGLAIERSWVLFRLSRRMEEFQLKVLNGILSRDLDALQSLSRTYGELPSARVLQVALDRRSAKDSRLRQKWQEATVRERLVAGQSLKRSLWILGTIATSTPFVGLFGTVVGILSSFQSMAKSGAGGFAVVAAGISEALIATAVGIVVAVIAVLAYNVLQTQAARLTMKLRLHTEEWMELLGAEADSV